MLQHLTGIFRPHLHRCISAYDRDADNFDFLCSQCHHDGKAVIDAGVTVNDDFLLDTASLLSKKMTLQRKTSQSHDMFLHM